MPEPTSNDIEDKCEKLIAVDVIEPIRKKDGLIQLCIEYRKLNKATIPRCFGYGWRPKRS